MNFLINSDDLFQKLSPQTACEVIRAAGFDGIDWSLDAEANPSLLEEQLAAIKESGLRVAQASLSAPLFDKDDAARTARLIEGARAMLALCQMAGCAYLIVPPISRQKEYGLSIAEIRARNLATYEALIPAAKACGVKVCLENSLINWRGYPYAGSCTYPEEARDLVDTLNEKAGQEIFGVCLNTGHLDLARSDFYAFLYKLGDRVKTLHINDNHSSFNDRILPMTGGVIRWDYVCRALGQNGYRGDLALDVSFARYDCDMMPSALSLAADCARVLRRRIGEE